MVDRTAGWKWISQSSQENMITGDINKVDSNAHTHNSKLCMSRARAAMSAQQTSTNNL